LDNQYIINPLSLHAILYFSFFFRYISLRSVSFRFVSIGFVSFYLISFGFVSHFTGTHISVSDNMRQAQVTTCLRAKPMQMPPKIKMKIEDKNVCKFRSSCILNTFSIDEKFKRGFWSRILENKKNRNHDSRKLKFDIFENFTNHGISIKDINRGSRE
jgi:hypothetical protein